MRNTYVPALVLRSLAHTRLRGDRDAADELIVNRNSVSVVLIAQLMNNMLKQMWLVQRNGKMNSVLIVLDMAHMRKSPNYHETT